jgi:hypothetical protein
VWLRCAAVPGAEVDSPAAEVDSHGHGCHHSRQGRFARPQRPRTASAPGRSPPRSSSAWISRSPVGRTPDATMNSSSPAAHRPCARCPLVAPPRKPAMRATTTPCRAPATPRADRSCGSLSALAAAAVQDGRASRTVVQAGCPELQHRRIYAREHDRGENRRRAAVPGYRLSDGHGGDRVGDGEL